MDNINYIFFEEYKRLNKLCSELYGDQNGISHYIDDMKNVPGTDCRYISGWKDDLSQLIRLRHIRNHLAHAEGAFDEGICTYRDIEWIQEFHKRILNQSDPLALLYQYSQSRQQMKKTNSSASKPYPPQPLPQVNINIREIKERRPPADKRRQNFYWIIFLIIMVGIFFLSLLEITGLLG